MKLRELGQIRDWLHSLDVIELGQVIERAQRSAQDQAFAGMATGALLDEPQITGTLVLAWLQQQLEGAA